MKDNYGIINKCKNIFLPGVEPGFQWLLISISQSVLPVKLQEWMHNKTLFSEHTL